MKRQLLLILLAAAGAAAQTTLPPSVGPDFVWTFTGVTAGDCIRRNDANTAWINLPSASCGGVIPDEVTLDTEWDTAAEINAATTDDDFATLTGAQTLTNKTVSGASNSITNLNANELSSGTVADARLPAEVPLTDEANTFTALQSFDGIALPGSASLPGSCSGNQVYVKTDGQSGRRVYLCESGTWTLQGTMTVAEIDASPTTNGVVWLAINQDSGLLTSELSAGVAEIAIKLDGSTLSQSASGLRVNATYNAPTATALAANGANCGTSGEVAAGVDASGVAEGCLELGEIVSATLTAGGVPYLSGGFLTTDADLAFDANVLTLGVGAAKGLRFGDGDSGWAEPSDDVLRGLVAGISYAELGGSYTAYFQNQTPTTGDTLVVVQAGEGEGGDIFRVNNEAGTAFFSVNAASVTTVSTINATTAYQVGGSALAFSHLDGAATDSQIPDNITINLAATASALANNPAALTNTFCLDRAADGSCAAEGDLDDLGGTIDASQFDLTDDYSFAGAIVFENGAAFGTSGVGVLEFTEGTGSAGSGAGKHNVYVDSTSNRLTSYENAGSAVTYLGAGDTITAPTLSGAVTGSGTHYYDFPEISVPSNPSANIARFYAKDSGGTTELCYRDSAGAETCVGDGAGGGSTYVKLYEFFGATGQTTTGWSVSSLGDGVYGPNITAATAGNEVSRSGPTFDDADGEILYIKSYIPPASSGVDLTNVNIRVGFKSATTSTDIDWFFSVTCLDTSVITTTAIESLTYTSLTKIEGTSHGTAHGMAYVEVNNQDISAACSPKELAYWRLEYDEVTSGGVAVVPGILIWTE